MKTHNKPLRLSLSLSEGRVVVGQGDRRPDVPGANGRRKRSAHQPVTSAGYPAKVSEPIEARPISREIVPYRDSLCIEGTPSKTAGDGGRVFVFTIEE